MYSVFACAQHCLDNFFQYFWSASATVSLSHRKMATNENIIKKYTKSSFSSEEEEALIDFVREEPCLFNPKHEQYKNFQYRKRKWIFIGSQLNKTGI